MGTHGDNQGYNRGDNKAGRCPGSLMRKPRSWPPLCPASPSAAPRFAERHGWQPQPWHPRP